MFNTQKIYKINVNPLKLFQQKKTPEKMLEARRALNLVLKKTSVDKTIYKGYNGNIQSKENFGSIKNHPKGSKIIENALHRALGEYVKKQTPNVGKKSKRMAQRTIIKEILNKEEKHKRVLNDVNNHNINSILAFANK